VSRIVEPYTLKPGATWYTPPQPVTARADEHAPEGFATLLAMQDGHFWYVGRHRFLYRALTASLRRYFPGRRDLRAVDLGGGCGGWVHYLAARSGGRFAELALADSSPRALDLADAVVGPDVRRYQIDLLDLGWKNRWDVAFLFDVLEHLPEEQAALRQVTQALCPGGLLLLACPALRFFWSYNDVLVHHCRRYSRRDYRRLAVGCGLELCRARYFMFLLSPLVWLTRVRGPDAARLSPGEARSLLDRTHRTPPGPVNRALALLFAAETPLGWHLPFPWGTSVLGVFRKPGGPPP
jgi:SAM-dependent methyltransferase